MVNVNDGSHEAYMLIIVSRDHLSGYVQLLCADAIERNNNRSRKLSTQLIYPPPISQPTKAVAEEEALIILVLAQKSESSPCSG